MSTVLVWREQFQKLYAKYSFYIIRILQFALGIAVFGMINSNIGFLKITSTSILYNWVGTYMCIFAIGSDDSDSYNTYFSTYVYFVIRTHVNNRCVFFFDVHIFICGLLPDQAWLILLTAVGFACKIPFAIVIRIGLLGDTIVFNFSSMWNFLHFYMVHIVKISSTSF